jgi:CheY-like chemotaxis protein
MTSIEQVLKGTETTRALRTQGVKSIICGLSANNLKSSFAQAGADDFQIKPFPCEHDDLYNLLKRLLSKRHLASTARSQEAKDVILDRSKDDVSRLGTVLDGASVLAEEAASGHGVVDGVVESKTNDEGDAARRKSSLALHEFSRAISVLFVDDDQILRRLAIRGLKKVMPNVHCREAASGMAALDLCKAEDFDVIFLDKYMDGTLSGIETASRLRQEGVRGSVICGLSANESSEEFLSAGADHFQLKPFPCGERDLKSLLRELLPKIQNNTSSEFSVSVTGVDVVSSPTDVMLMPESDKASLPEVMHISSPSLDIADSTMERV